MHLIVLTGAAQGCPAAAQNQDLAGLIERWSPLMTRLTPGWVLHDEPDALNTLAEQARARLLLGRPLTEQDNGLLPLSAWTVDEAPPAGLAWGRLTPFHGLVGSDRITLVPPQELDLSEAESRALFAAVEPLFTSEGVALRWVAPLSWQVQHDSLRDLPCASLDRAAGDSVQRWQGKTRLSAARLLRRLQNEAQMVLHNHPVNEQRSQRRALTVNSLWLDHAGAAGGLRDEPTGADLARAWARIQTQPLAAADAALQAWVDAALLPAADDPPTLVLCGRHAAQSFTMRPVSQGWRGVFERTLRRPPRTVALRDWLQQLDAEPQQDPRP